MRIEIEQLGQVETGRMVWFVFLVGEKGQQAELGWAWNYETAAAQAIEIGTRLSIPVATNLPLM